MENRHQEYHLTIKGPSVPLIVGYLQENYGWVFSTFAQTDFFHGFAIGYCPTYEVSAFLGLGINDGTMIVDIDTVEDF